VKLLCLPYIFERALEPNIDSRARIDRQLNIRRITSEDIRRRFNIDRVIVVAGRGMISARVKGHIMICFLALVMETALCRKLKEIGSAFSYAEILEDLKEISAVELTVEGKRFLARTEMMGNAYDAFKALKIRPPDLLKEIA